ncbi:hypothetical protein, partial [Proteus faecis]
MNGKVNNDIIYERKISTFSPSKEVEKVNKQSVKQAQIINTVTNEKLINDVVLKDKNSFEYPVLRAPIEQEENSKKIDTKSDLNFNIKTAATQEDKAQPYPQKKETEREYVLNSPVEANRKEEILANQKHLYDDCKCGVNQNSININLTIKEHPSLSTESSFSPPKGTNTYLYL